MCLVFEITQALESVPESDRLSMAIAVAAHMTAAYMGSEKAVSSGFVRVDPKRIGVTIGEIIQGARKNETGKNHDR